MHYRFLVTFESGTAKNSTQARRYAAQTLDAQGFVCPDEYGDRGVSTDDRWDDCMADWYVVGGRWSGELSRHSWAKLISAEMDALEREHDVQVWGAFYGDEEKQREQRELAERFQAMWNAAAPFAFRGIPIQRNTYKLYGYEDDAMLLTEELYNALLREYAGQQRSEYHIDLDGDDVSREMVGHKWLVVVDYHS
jgi:hypothetical protein